jgi:sugar phosphate permease
LSRSYAVPADRASSRRLVIFALLGAAYFLSQFFRSANAVIAPDLSSELSIGAAQLGLMTSLFYAAFSGVQLPLGAALDRFGARVVTPSLMVVGAGGSLLFGAGHSFAVLALGRALIGMGMAGVYMGSLKIFSQWFDIRGFATASSFLVGLGAVGALAAATPLAWASETVGWRAVFLWGGVAVILSAASIYLWVRDAPPGVDWKSHHQAGGLGRIFRSLAFWRIAFMDVALVGNLLSVQGLWGGPFLYDVYGMSRVQVGNHLLQMSGAAVVGYLAGGWFSRRVSTPRLVVCAGALFVVSLVLMSAGGATGAVWMVWVAYPLFGFSAAFNPLLMAHARSVFPTSMTGRAVTAVNFFAIGGAAVTMWCMGVLIGSFGRDAQGHYPPEAYALTFALSAVITVVAILFYVPLARRPASRPG